MQYIQDLIKTLIKNTDWSFIFKLFAVQIELSSIALVSIFFDLIAFGKVTLENHIQSFSCCGVKKDPLP